MWVYSFQKRCVASIPDLGMTIVAMKLQVPRRFVPVLDGLPGLVVFGTIELVLTLRILFPEGSAHILVLG